MKYLEFCVTSLKRNCIKAEMKKGRFTCWGTSCTAASELWETCQDCEVTRITFSVSQKNLVSSALKNKLRHIFCQHVISTTPLEPSVNSGGQFITSDTGFPKSHYYPWVHTELQELKRRAASEWTDDHCASTSFSHNKEGLSNLKITFFLISKYSV